MPTPEQYFEQFGLYDTSHLSKMLAKLWRDDSDRRLSDVVAENYRLSPETEADPGPVDLEVSRYWREPIDFANDSRVRKITIRGSTQVAKTVFTQGVVLALSEVDPAPAMYLLPTRDEVNEQRDRIYGNALASEPMFANRVPPKRMWNLRKLDFIGMIVYLAYAKSPQRMRGKPCKRVFRSEVDVFDFNAFGGDPMKASEERIKQFPDSLIWSESSPHGEESRIDAEYCKSDQRSLHVECPHCGAKQQIRFFTYVHGELSGRGGVAGYTDDAGNLLDPEEARKKAYYVCVKGCRIDQAFKNSLIAGGVWIPRGLGLDEIEAAFEKRKKVIGNDGGSELDGGRVHYQKAKNADGKEVDAPVVGPKGVRHIGYHIWTIFNPKISIGDIAAAYIEFRNDGNLREFVENWIGWKFKTNKKIADWKQVALRYSSDYSIGIVPSTVWFLTAGIDVQEDRIYYVVLGWAPGRTPYLIAWGVRYKTVGKIAAEPQQHNDDESDDDEAATVLISSDLQQIPDAVLDLSWQVEGGSNPLGYDRLSVRVAGIDSNYRTREVHDWIQSVDYGDRIRAVRGDHQVDPAQKYRMNVVEKNTRTGETYEGGLEQWGIYVDGYESIMCDRMAAQPGTIGALRLPINILPAGQEFLKQLCNKVRTTERDDRGRQKTVYKILSKKIGVDLRDCCIYAEALADMAVADIGWSEAAWLEWRERQLQNLQMQNELNEADDFSDLEDDYLKR